MSTAVLSLGPSPNGIHYPAHHRRFQSHEEQEKEEVLNETNDNSRYFLHRKSSQARRRSVRLMSSKDTTMVSSPSLPSSPMSYCPPTSPIDYLFRQYPSLSPGTSPRQERMGSKDDRHPVSPILNRVGNRRNRSKSASVQIESQELTSAHLSIIPDVLRQLSSKEKESLLHSQMPSQAKLKTRQRPKSSNGGPSMPSAVHFRPVPFEVKAELDNFFGQTKGQKRELALRTKGDDGHLWYDRMEQEEFAHLLSSPNSLFDSSRRSSVTSTVACRSPRGAYSRRPSGLSSCQAFVPNSPGTHDLAAFTYIPPSAFSTTAPGVTHDGQGTTSDAVDRNERRRKRSQSVLQRGNVVADHQPLQGPSDLEEEEGRTGEGCRKANISMPAFLPLKRHQASTALLDEAFRASASDDQADTEEGEIRSKGPSSLTSRLESKGRKRPANLNLHFCDVEELQATTTRRPSRPVSFSPGSNVGSGYVNPFGDGNNDRVTVARRGSSFDIGCLSPRTLQTQQMGSLGDQASPASPDAQRSSQADNRTKAATLLGMHAGNENLLVPAGLPTGEHVYDGLDIPCRSVHLQSDDEDEEPVKGRKGRPGASVKAWLKSKKG